MLVGFPSVVFASESPSPCNTSGNLIKIKEASSVYYCGADGFRYVFPNEKIYFSWYADFSNIKEISDDEMASVPIAGNILYAPAKQLIKIQTDPKVYAVGQSGVLRWVSSEDIAKSIYGSSWASLVQDLSDAFFVDYRIGRSIVASTEYSSSWNVYKKATISQSIKAGQRDIVDLPEDIPRYPNANITSVTSLGAKGDILSFESFDARSGIASWIVSSAQKDGWMPEEGLKERVIFGDLFLLKFTKSENGRVFELIVLASKTSYSIERILQDEQASISPSVPLYPSATIWGGGSTEEGTQYFALSSDSRVKIFEWYDAWLQKNGWVETQNGDQDTQIIRQYERSVGSTLRNVGVYIFPLEQHQGMCFIVFVEGDSISFQEVSLSEIAESLR